MVKELNQINVDTQRKKEEWNKKILELAAAQKEAYHKAYMSKKGATENGWFESDAGKSLLMITQRNCYQTNRTQNSIKTCSIKLRKMEKRRDKKSVKNTWTP